MHVAAFSSPPSPEWRWRIMSADQKALRTVSAVGAAVEDELNMLRDQDTVFLHTGLNFDHRAVARVAGNQLFGVVDHQFDRPAGQIGQRITKRNVVAVALSAEITADIAGMDDQACRRNLQSVAHLIAQAEWTLIR